MAQPPIFQSRDTADPALWDERLTREHTPWDAVGVPATFRQFCEAQPTPLSTLVSSCGSAYEAGQLAERGRPVTAIGLALSAMASARTMLGPHADVVQLADFLHFSSPHPMHWAYERAFLCTVSRRLWPDYAAQVTKLLPPHGLPAGFFTVVEDREAIPKGPPFETTQPELGALLPPAFRRISDMLITETDSIPVSAERGRWQAWRRRAD